MNHIIPLLPPPQIQQPINAKAKSPSKKPKTIPKRKSNLNEKGEKIKKRRFDKDVIYYDSDLINFDNDTHQIKYPIVLSSAVKVLDLGRVIPDKKAFHAKNYIWPLGFRSVRTYTSMNNNTKRANFYCEIIEKDNKPAFKVTPEEDPENFVVAHSGTL